MLHASDNYYYSYKMEPTFFSPFSFWDVVLLCRQSLPKIHNPPASVFQVLGIQECTLQHTVLSLHV